MQHIQMLGPRICSLQIRIIYNLLHTDISFFSSELFVYSFLCTSSLLVCSVLYRRRNHCSLLRSIFSQHCYWVTLMVRLLEHEAPSLAHVM
jgi:hypothetical protein